jgi:hypothetical protein
LTLAAAVAALPPALAYGALIFLAAIDVNEGLAEAADKSELLKLTPHRLRVAQVRHLAAPLVPMLAVVLMCWTVSWLVLGRHSEFNALVVLTCVSVAIAGVTGAGLSLAREWQPAVRTTDLALPAEVAGLNMLRRYLGAVAIVVFGTVPLFEVLKAGLGHEVNRIVALTSLSVVVSCAALAWLVSADALRRFGWAVVARHPTWRRAV